MPYQNIIIEPRDFVSRLDEANMVIVDLCKPEVYQQAHVPGAIHMDYASLVHNEKPRFGLLPSEEQFAEVLSKAGIRPDSLVVAYDDEGGGKAARLLWTLMLAGHEKLAMLDGGMHAWVTDQLPTSKDVPVVTPGDYPVSFSNNAIRADRQYILDNLDKVTLLDARSPGEYAGTDIRAARGGHIPGAINFEWTKAMELNNGLRLFPAEELMDVLEAIKITPDSEVIVYCHSHHRSALSFIMLRALGFDRVRGYPGSWSDWGNCEDTPVEQ